MKKSSPVVIGGVGGSGTRVVAEILESLGYNIGADLNPAKDNLWFLLLFKRPRWYRQAQRHKKQIFTGLSLLTNSMIDRTLPTCSELKFLMVAVLEISIFGHNYRGDGRGSWPFVHAWRMLTMKEEGPSTYAGWGWKEPNTHIFLEYLAEYFEHLKYIHTIRHGLDMAFSKNQQQLYNWGPVYGVELTKSKSGEPAASLKYWIRSNKRVIEIGEMLGDQKFLAINFDKLCLSPASEIQKIVSFLNIKPGAGDLKTACNIPQKPKSLGRYRDYNLDQFDLMDLQEVEAFGFPNPIF